jgi:hypothetical protein
MELTEEMKQDITCYIIDKNEVVPNNLTFALGYDLAYDHPQLDKSVWSLGEMEECEVKWKIYLSMNDPKKLEEAEGFYGYLINGDPEKTITILE